MAPPRRPHVYTYRSLQKDSSKPTCSISGLETRQGIVDVLRKAQGVVQRSWDRALLVIRSRLESVMYQASAGTLQESYWAHSLLFAYAVASSDSVTRRQQRIAHPLELYCTPSWQLLCLLRAHISGCVSVMVPLLPSIVSHGHVC